MRIVSDTIIVFRGSVNIRGGKSVKEKIESVLEKSGIKVLCDEHIGPCVNRVDVFPEKTPISKMREIYDDVMTEFGERNIRVIEPTNQRPYFSYEIPKEGRTKRNVGFSVVDNKNEVVLGNTFNDESVILDIDKCSPVLIGGCTGSGKTMCIENMLLSLVDKNTPEDLKIILADLKGGYSWEEYKNLPHLIKPIVTDCETIIEELSRLKVEAERRSLNGVMTANKMLLIIDGIDDLMCEFHDEAEELLHEIMQMSVLKNIGISIILSVQRLTKKNITGLLKVNLKTRIALYSATYTGSNLILDCDGAETLDGPGDMLVSFDNGDVVRTQGVLVSKNDRERIVLNN